MFINMYLHSNDSKGKTCPSFKDELGDELLISKMQKNWGIIDFVSEIRNLKGHPNFEKLIFLTR